jgi:Icc-related predicted phosphoesterase
MKICCLSDLHGHFIDIEPCDLVLICGDSVDLKCQSGFHKAFRWYNNKFRKWASELPCDKVLFISGNHDPLEEYTYKMSEIFPKEDKITYLCDELYEYTKDEQTIKIYGTPWCKVFGNWHFMLHNDELTDKYNSIPDHVDILMTHDAPFGTSDICLQDVPFNTFSHIGNVPLKEAVKRTLPKIVIHGHLHSSNHEYEYINDIKVVNVSILDEKYQVTYKPLYIDGKNL